MALLFSAVTVAAGEDEIELLVGGIPREYDDLEGWSEFDDLQVKVSGLAESVTSSVPISLSAYATKDIGDTLTISSSAITAAIILFFIIVLQPPPGSKSNYYSRCRYHWILAYTVHYLLQLCIQCSDRCFINVSFAADASACWERPVR